MDIDHLKLPMTQPAPFFLGVAIITGMDALLIFSHLVEITQAKHGIATALLCYFSILGWIPLLFVNSPSDEDFDWIPSALSVAGAACVSVMFGFGYSPLPYELWSYHTFFFWLINAAFVAVGFAYYVTKLCFD
uniref:Uncharacterized protein n=1 Tax=Acetobacter pasteurianus TaxID=438 RepID=I3W081_ACEPA|nr:hypothetical protein [Acetobacter pasteurianus]AFK89008.1 hypothetical protein [Acetobacter pasteurianus]